MFLLILAITLVASYFAREEYIKGRTGLAMFWAALVGWDLHTLITAL